ncbi:MAG: branched-chain amino acid ABC transporter ATP-binding protein [Firmicutes bacterium HGW-Firmicutes-11]|nr:MAG: branched-chain amino acid ABC transporter ATP-binding protein [Firmicutes bacterium HGW-Firmicutes-11]
MSEILLRAEDIYANYGDFQAVQGASFEIRKGEIISIIGTNGAGKSTLMKAIGGTLAPKSGKVFYKDTEITGMPTHKLVDLGMSQVPEGGRVFARMTVMDNLVMGSYTPRARKHKDNALERVYDLFPVLKEKANQVSGSLSGGQRQMVAIGRALMSEPELVCFDEISLGLAPTVIKDIYTKIRQINKEGMTIILVEQDVKRSLKTSDRSYVMLKGKVVLSGKSSELAEEDVKKAYFGL